MSGPDEQATAASVTAPSSGRARGWTGWRSIRPASIAAVSAQKLSTEMLGVDAAPTLPAEHRRAVTQDDLSGCPLGAGRAIGLRAGRHGGERVLLRAPDAVKVRDELKRDLFEHGLEQRLLGQEVMIDRAFRDARAGGDLVHRRRRKAERFFYDPQQMKG
jgi:hypothetical protein